MAHPSYDPYYLPHPHHHHLPPSPEYYNHHTAVVEATVPTYISARKLHPTNISKIPIHIPKEKRHINTLFVSGLPDDVLPREIHNLFCRRSGFDSCQLKFTGRGNQVVAFVTFFNHQSAVLALQALDGVQFDPQDGTVLHIELARSNSRRKRKSGSGPYVVINKRRKAANDAEEMSSEDGDNESNNSHQSGDQDQNNSSSDDEQTDEKSDVKKADLNDPKDAANKPTEKTSGDLQPCSTLFIANLGSKCKEEELKQALSEYHGFKGLKRRVKGTVAFADYEEVEQATNAMQGLQGTTLPSSDKGAMVIEYARSKMRKT
ncbi:uncharacterized protein LOC141633287 [Silene latifolia]|uniref:uncharacterized protein LOC141633287 n=1 Tax=Silene latifolia TaxID=37657 RepID=UPI003D7781CA